MKNIDKLTRALVAWLCLSATAAAAQQTEELATASPIAMAKVDLYRIFGFYQAANLSLEYRVSETVYFENEIGYIFDNWTRENPFELFYDNEVANPSGFSVGHQVRIYFKPYVGGNSFSHFVAPEIAFRYIRSDGLADGTIACGQGCEFNQFFTFPVDQYQYLYRVRWGFQEIFGNKLLGELSWGVGFLYNEARASRPQTSDRLLFLERLDDIREGTRLHLMVSVKLGWVASKRY